MVRGVVIFFLFLTSLSTSLWAQYHLHEVGVAPAVGVDVPLGNTKLLPLPSLGFSAFYSHFACGKSYGYHATLGFRLANLYEPSTNVDQGIRSSGAAGSGTLHFLWVEPGIYFKIRGHKQHKAKETSFLFGPKLSIRTVAFSTGADSLSGIYGNTSYQNPAWVSPAIHASLWIKRPLTRKSTIFVEPGIEAHVLPWANTGGKPFFTSLYLYCQIGILLWDNK
jgi:hypothetical protein